MTVNIRRVFGRRWFAILVLTCVFCTFVYEYQQLDTYQQEVRKSHKSPAPHMDRLPVRNLTKVLMADREYEESVLAKIRKLVEVTKDYTTGRPREGAHNDAPKGIAQRVDTLIGRKTGRAYIEIGLGTDEEDKLIQWLEEARGWSGLVLEPSVQHYNGGMSGRSRAKVFRSCIEVGNKTWYHSRDPVVVQGEACFPLGAVVKALFGDAAKQSEVIVGQQPEVLNDAGKQPELLAVNSDGKELEILGAFPFKTIKVKVVLIALKGALVDTMDYHRLMELQGYKAVLISNNHAIERTYLLLERGS